MQFNGIFSKMIERHRLNGEVQKAKESFSDKPFVIEYRPVLRMAKVTRYALAIFSVVTGFGFLFSVFGSALPFAVAVVLAAVALVLVELLKSQLGGIAFRSYYRTAKLPAVVLPAVALFALSVYFSLHGVQSLYSQLDKSEADLQAVHVAQMDSIKSYYDSEVARAEKALADFKNSVSWKGKINIYNKTTAGTIERYNAELNALHEQFNAVKADAQRSQREQLNALHVQNSFNSLMWVMVSGCVELAIIACIWFMVYYAYRAASDGEVLTGHERFTVSLDQLRSFAEHALIGSHTAALPVAESGKQPIGFRRSEPLPNRSQPLPNHGTTVPEPFQGVASRGLSAVNTGINTTGYLTKYPEVVSSLKDGASIGECVKLHGVSRSTVQNVRRCLRALDK